MDARVSAAPGAGRTPAPAAESSCTSAPALPGIVVVPSSSGASAVVATTSPPPPPSPPPPAPIA
ncbi:hypothetical protein BJF88_17480 [Cellulosimicrobium sp. CUA-896]|nr:hypothetical protein BJF88_17480 [Cellulosimicrobium sp. CUA-896]